MDTARHQQDDSLIADYTPATLQPSSNNDAHICHTFRDGHGNWGVYAAIIHD